MDSEREVVIVGAARTAIGSFLGSLATVPVTQLGAVVIREAVARAGIRPAQVDEVLMGIIVTSALGQAPARQAAIAAGLPPTVGATTLNKVCGSALKAVTLGAGMIRAGDADIVVAGGMENMSLAPYMLPKARTGYRLGNDRLLDAVIHDGLWCPFEDTHMGNLAELTAREYGVSREAQDEFALNSHRKALAAIEAGKFKAEIAPVSIPQKKGEPILFDRDECPRADTSLEKLAKLRPAFEEGGTVTAGNSPGITDGAAAVVLMSRDRADKLGLTPLARIVGYAQAALEPKWLFIAPVQATHRVLERTGLSLDAIDLIECNEAFASQMVANGKLLGWDWDRVNVHGGSIALGHPIGASGARILVTLLYAMADRGVKRGLASICLGGGEAVAMIVER